MYEWNILCEASNMPHRRYTDDSLMLLLPKLSILVLCQYRAAGTTKLVYCMGQNKRKKRQDFRLAPSMYVCFKANVPQHVLRTCQSRHRTRACRRAEYRYVSREVHQCHLVPRRGCCGIFQRFCEQHRSSI